MIFLIKLLLIIDKFDKIPYTIKNMFFKIINISKYEGG